MCYEHNGVHVTVIESVCIVDQCHRLPRQKLTKVENLISSNSGSNSLAMGDFETLGGSRLTNKFPLFT